MALQSETLTRLQNELDSHAKEVPQIITLLHGDAYSEMQNLIDAGVKVDLIITDPPYDNNCSGGGGSINNSKCMKVNTYTKAVTDLGIDNGFDYAQAFQLWGALQKNINIYIFCNKKQIPIYMQHYVLNLKCTFDILFWHKTNVPPAYANKYLTDCEYILHFRKGAKCHPRNYYDAATVYLGHSNVVDKQKYEHPTIKPVELVKRFVRNSSHEGDIILDCFMGSGTTGEAALSQGRNFIGIESEEKYFKISTQRLKMTEVFSTHKTWW